MDVAPTPVSAARLDKRAAGDSRRSTHRSDARSGANLLEPIEGGPAERFAEVVGAENPIRVFVVAVLAGYVLLLGLTIAMGLLVTKVLLQINSLASWDERVSRSLARARTPTGVDLSWIGSTLAGGVVIPIIVGVLLACFLTLRRWRLAAFTLFVICIESGTYRATTLVVHRNRPKVDRLEALPVEASFPSGHTAASVAFFGGLLLVLASRTERRAVKIALWSLAVAIPLFVIWSRTARGMHHPSDVAAGVLLGVGALVVTLFAARAAGVAAERRDLAATRGGSTR
jgi:membrane-associated phospholipid phosphatase